MVVPVRIIKCGDSEEGNFSESPCVIKMNLVMQFMLKCRYGSSKVDRRVASVWLCGVMEDFCGGIWTVL